MRPTALPLVWLAFVGTLTAVGCGGTSRVLVDPKEIEGMVEVPVVDGRRSDGRDVVQVGSGTATVVFRGTVKARASNCRLDTGAGSTSRAFAFTWDQAQERRLWSCRLDIQSWTDSQPTPPDHALECTLLLPPRGGSVAEEDCIPHGVQCLGGSVPFVLRPASLVPEAPRTSKSLLGVAIRQDFYPAGDDLVVQMTLPGRVWSASAASGDFLAAAVLLTRTDDLCFGEPPEGWQDSFGDPRGGWSYDRPPPVPWYRKLWPW
jgi:hypothetical protein